jgi:flagellar motor protein MotB
MRPTRRSEPDSIWAPLADVMTLVTTVFLLICVVEIVRYRRAEEAIVRSCMDQRKQLDEVARAVAKACQSLGTMNLALSHEPGTCSISIKDEIFFTPGEAEIQAGKEQEFQALIQQTAETIHKVLTSNPGIQVIVAGHTDGDPMQRKKDVYRTNHHLSAARAAEIVAEIENYLGDRLSPEQRRRFFAAGFSYNQPPRNLEPSDSPDVQKKKRRRVEIRIEPILNLGRLLVPGEQSN